MQFVDECELRVEAGDGGNGAIAFRREKFLPLGGPSGGDGGRGGDVVFVADGGVGTLQDLAFLRTVRAERGQHGGGSDCHGRSGPSIVVRVPLGTVVRDAATGDKLTELTRPGERVVVARGGRGGRGNLHFRTERERAPRRAEKGDPGEKRDLALELRLLADVGLLGFPNVGKSTFIANVSRARPKIADYPFTTLAPSLGVVSLDDPRQGGGRGFIIADIPGLIPGASEGAGLGARFLRHVERTRVLLHLVTLADDPDRDPLQDYEQLRHELGSYRPELLARQEIVALSQADRPEVVEAYEPLRERFAARGVALELVSAVSRRGLDPLLAKLWAAVAVPTPPEPLTAAPRVHGRVDDTDDTDDVDE